jgi:hypothetical protein
VQPTYARAAAPRRLESGLPSYASSALADDPARGTHTQTDPQAGDRGGESHAYVFELGERQFTSFTVDQQGSDVVITITDADGAHTRVDRPNGSRGRETVSYIAARAGAYRLEIKMLEKAAPRGYYEITMNEPRPATARDESRLAAELAVSEGEVLRARKMAASLSQAIEKFGQAIASLAGARRAL